MKHLTLAISLAAFALPLCAQDKPAASSTTSSTVLAQPEAPQTEESALVRAAKATKRLTKKPSMVITNDTLVKSGGHLTVANQSPNPPLSSALPKPDTSVAKIQADLRAKAEADAKAKKDADDKGKQKETAAEKAQKLNAAAADLYGESIEERVDDPATQEHVMNQMTSTQPQTTTAAQPPTAQPSKPPQD